MSARTLEDLLALEEIRRLKYRYCRSLDTRRWDEFAACLTPDVTADYAGLRAETRQGVVDYMRENLPAQILTTHHVHHPEIDLDGPDRATGVWYLFDSVLVPEADFALEGAALYSDVYRRTDQGWQIAHTEYVRTYEASWKLSETPSWKLSDHAIHPEAR